MRFKKILLHLKKITMNLSEKVKFYRELKQMSQENLAFDLGINQSQYSRRESGRINFNSEEIYKLIRILEITPNELFVQHTIILKNTNHMGGNLTQYINPSEDLVEQFKCSINDKDQIISLLMDKIKILEQTMAEQMLHREIL